MNRRILLFVFVTLSVAIATPASGVPTQNPRPTEGAVWEFTTVPYVVIDDFETYTSDANLRETWEDYYSHPTWGSYVYRSTEFEPNHSPPYAMKFQYYWQSIRPKLFTLRTYDEPQDWTKGGLAALALWFYGDANDSVWENLYPITADDMYVTLGDDDDDDGDVDDRCTIYYVADCGGDVCDLIANQWIEWNLSLEDFNDPARDGNNVNPNKIKSIAIGVTTIDGTTEKGRIWFDDIRLYVCRCLPEYAPGDVTGDCFTDYEDLKHFSACWLDFDGQPNGIPDECEPCDIYPPEGDGEVNFKDYAVLMEYWLTWQPFPPED